MTANHGCRFSWCQNNSAIPDAALLEHFNAGESIPATGGSLRAIGRDNYPYDELLPTITVGVTFNEDLEPAPNIFLNTSDTEYLLRLDEAVLLYNAMGNVIRSVVADSRLSPARIAHFYDTTSNAFWRRGTERLRG